MESVSLKAINKVEYMVLMNSFLLYSLANPAVRLRRTGKAFAIHFKEDN